MVRKLIIKLVLFCLPFALLMSAVVALAWHTGDARPLNDITQLQAASRDVLYTRDLTRETLFEYRYLAIKQQRPEIMSLGTSRSFYFMDDFVNRCPSAFYNSALIGSSIYELEYFVQRLAEDDLLPKILFLNIDDIDYNLGAELRAERRVQVQEKTGLEQLLAGSEHVASRLISRPVILGDVVDSFSITERLRYGIDLLTDGSGGYYAGDGSTSILQGSPEALIAQNVQMLVANEAMYQRGTEIDDASLASLENLLKIAQSQGMTVLGFYPPYHDAVWSRMDDNPEYAYIPVARQAIAALFEAYQFSLYDFTHAETAGGADSEMIDSWHPGPLLTLRMFRVMANDHADLFAGYVDFDVTQQQIMDAPNPRTIGTTEIVEPCERDAS